MSMAGHTAPRPLHLGRGALVLLLAPFGCSGLAAREIDPRPDADMDVAVCDPEPVEPSRCWPACNEMVPVPAGEYLFGYEGEIEPSQRFCPHRCVFLDAFEIDVTETTVAEYGACVTAGGCTEPLPRDGSSWGVEGREDHPIDSVTWQQARGYCEWARKRLCTEAEWEKAARADGRVYPWGDDPPSCELATIDDSLDASRRGCGTGHTLPVGSTPAGSSPYGAVDMAGNVWEWVEDFYDRTCYFNECDERCVNPQGPESGALRVVRGGGYATRASNSYLCASARSSAPPESARANLGFRCCR